ncbi:MAG: carboxylesterase family protein [Gammaproteobacteria bacterium]|nr:carboxylesterase family protein [Gammaproteobacteria bacterium]
MTHRSFFRGLVASVSLVLVSGVGAAPVQTESGAVEGITLPGGIRAWMGVPFAAPPVRELRWRAPQPAAKWQGVFHADRAAPMCLQALRSRTMNHYFGNEGISEDCLYLNIWSPPTGERLPVIVWVYGGGFNVGSASMANYSGAGLASDGVVRVNIAYRVGALGFLAHPELTRESGYSGSGNYGLMDQIAALRWIQRNIAAFGGDPGNVTIAGQSAGSSSVSLLQASPEARGLFHRVVGMSGSPFGEPMSVAPLAQGEAAGLELQRALGAKSIEDLRDIAGDRILASPVQRPAIVIDGKYVAGTPREVFASHRHSDVPVMLGFTRDETFRPLGSIGSVADYEAAVRRNFPQTADALIKAYAAADLASAQRAATDMGRDASVGLSMFNWASAQREFGKAPAFAYFFTRRQPYAPGITFIDHDPATAGAYHTVEVPYFMRSRESLNLFRQTRNWEPVDVSLEENAAQALLTFARDGRPRVPRVADWPAFDPQRPRMLEFGPEVRMIDWPNAAALPLLRGGAPAERPAATGRPRD